MKISDITVSSQEFASFIGVSRRTIENWKRDDGLPHLKRGLRLIEAFQWWRENRFKEFDVMRAARTRREVARALREELKAETESGRLIPREQVVVWLSLLSSTARSHFLGLPKRLSGQLAVMSDEKEIVDLLRAEVRQALMEFVIQLKKIH